MRRVVKNSIIIRDKKLRRLKELLKQMKRVIVAYSGGVDSTFLLYMAKEVLGRKNVLAITALSESFPVSERRYAQKMAKKLGVKHILIETEELSEPNFRKNPVERCYYCKKELFSKLNAIAREKKYLFVLDGSTQDDLRDLRFGRIAAREEKIRSPIQEAGICKNDVRRFLKKYGIECWNRPSFACLASRFAYYEDITREKLRSIAQAEEFIKKLGFRQIRVRCHNNIVRIEIDKCEIKRMVQDRLREKIIARLKSLGFVYITLDLMGYRTGSMNEELKDRIVDLTIPD